MSITLTLTTAICFLVLVSVGGVLGVSVWLAQKNTLALLGNSANQAIIHAVSRIENHLTPASDLVEFVAKRLEQAEVDTKDHKALGKFLTGSLAAGRQIEAVSFLDADLKSVVAHRSKAGRVRVSEINDSRDQQVIKRWAKLSTDLKWAAPIWRPQSNKTYLNAGYPVMRDGKRIGAVSAVVAIRELSSFVRQRHAEPGKRFVLYGRDHVLAHPLMTRGYPGLSAKQPLPALAGFRDTILAAIWQQKDRFDLIFKMGPGSYGHALRIDGKDYVFIFRRLHGFGPKPMIVGAYFGAAKVGTEIHRLLVSIYVGVGALILSLIAAAILGRRIARPIVRFSRAASQVQNLDLDHINDLPGSVFRELDQQSKAFNAMLRALRWFELYIPKKIVDRLVKRGDIGETTSAERDVTVMFTDIAGFSTISESLTAPEVAALVNRHFEIVAGCIEAEDGTVDKFIGDSVMAFWGAPDPQADAAARACRAGLAIADAIRRENVQRRADGEAPIGIRIGIHTGSVTVGNIGAPGRINYTIIGDTVNVGQRLEQLGKELYPPKSEVTMLISGATAASMGAGFDAVSAGEHALKGRDTKIEVFKLL